MQRLSHRLRKERSKIGSASPMSTGAVSRAGVARFERARSGRAYLYWFNDADQASLHASSGLTRNYGPKPSFDAVAHLLAPSAIIASLNASRRTLAKCTSMNSAWREPQQTNLGRLVADRVRPRIDGDFGSRGECYP